MGWIIFYLVCAGFTIYLYKSAKVGYQTKDGFFYGIQKPNNKEQDNEQS